MDLLLFQELSHNPRTMGWSIIVLIAKFVLEVLSSEWNQILIQNVSVQHPSYIPAEDDQVRSTTMMKYTPNPDRAFSTCLIEHYTIILQCFSKQPPHPNTAIDTMEQETGLVDKHNMALVMDNEITLLSGKTQTKSFVASSQLMFLDGSCGSITPL